MATPRGGSGADAGIAAAGSNGAVDSPPGSSYMGSDVSEHSIVSCRWRDSQYHDQECSRYFDCPSHVVEREQPLDQPEEQTAAEIETTAASPPGMADDRTASNISEETPVSRVEYVVREHPEEDDAVQEDASPAPTTSATSQEATETTEFSQTRPVALPTRTSSMTSRRHDSSQARDSTWVQSYDSSTVSLASTREHRDDRRRQGSSRSSRNTDFEAATDQRQESLMQALSRSPPQQPPESADSSSSEFVLPRWQPDAEVTLCPICHTQFSIFVRKHHCRKCGRVVCNSCSPHRIIIPHQYIVRPPGSEISISQSLLADNLGVRYFESNGLSGGERVRLCNPCVPDPNTAPPQSPTSPSALSPRSSHQRSRSSLNAYGVAPSTNRYGGVFTAGNSRDGYRYYSPRSRSITMGPPAHGATGGPPSRNRNSVGSVYQSPFDRFLAVGPSSMSAVSHRSRHGSLGGDPSSSRQRALPPTPQIAEEDECPICHRELPSQSLPNFESLRESHINSCILDHSTYGSPSPRNDGGGLGIQAAPRRTGMYTYPATEKDCVDDAECTICLEEFSVGVSMARLECLCRFHRACIAAWFVNHPGRCPVHQHDGFGY